MSSTQLTATTKWINGIVAPAEPSGAVRLFCFPHAGGGASVFRDWVNRMTSLIEVYPIQLPGREGRWNEPFVTRASDLIKMLKEAVGPLLQPPYAFFGHSMGAFIAFELARTLRGENRPQPEVLIVSGARAPSMPDPNPPIHELPEDLLLEELKRLDGIPDELLNQRDLMSLLLPTLRADLSMCEAYKYDDEPPLDCAISVYGGEADKKVEPDHLKQWSAETTGPFQLRLFSGNHFFFLRDAQKAVMEAVREDLQPYAKRVAGNDLSQRPQLEQMIARVWAELLRVPEVGIDDNFFDLGANSLLVIQAHGKLREASINTLSVLDLFQYPTVRLLAGAIGNLTIGSRI